MINPDIQNLDKLISDAWEKRFCLICYIWDTELFLHVYVIYFYENGGVTES